MSTSESIFLTATKDQVINGEFWAGAVSTITDRQKVLLTSRIQAMQLMMNSRYMSAQRITSQLSIDGQAFVLVITRQ